MKKGDLAFRPENIVAGGLLLAGGAAAVIMRPLVGSPFRKPALLDAVGGGGKERTGCRWDRQGVLKVWLILI